MTEREDLSREIVECLDGALRLQSSVTEVTVRAYETAGLTTGERALRGRVTGLFYGVIAHLEALNRLIKEDS
jgi:hypothetical protein